jgi:hypothetical protein
MFSLPSFISLRISIIAVSDEFGGSTVVFLVFTIYRHLYLLIVDVQSDM